MAINRFQTPVAPEYKPTTLRIPFEELMAQGVRKQQAYDSNEEAEYKLAGIMQQLQADPNAKFAKKIVDDKYNKRMTDLSTTIADKGDVDYEKELRKIAAEYNNDPLVQTIKQRKANYDIYQKDRIDKKDDYVDFYDPYAREKGLDLEGLYKKTGQLNPFEYGGMKQRQDYLKVGQSLINDIFKEGSVRDVYARNEDGSLKYNALGQIMRTKRGSEGLERDTLQKVANKNAEPFLLTKEGGFFLDQIAGQELSYDKLSPEKQMYARQEAAKYLASLGEKQLGLKTTRGESVDNLTEYQFKTLHPDDEETDMSYEKGVGTEVVYTPVISDKYLNKQGGSDKFYTYSPGSGGAKQGGEAPSYKAMPEKEQQKFNKILSSLAPKLDPKSDEAYEVVKSYVNSMKDKKMQVNTDIITSDYVRKGEKGRSTREDATTDIIANYRYRTFYNTTTGKKVSGSDPEFFKKMGYKDKEEFAKDFQVTGEIGAKNLLPTLTGDPDVKNGAFVDPLAATGKHGDFAVSRPESELKGVKYQTHKIINDVFHAFQELPGIDNTVEIDTPEGKVKFKTSVEKDPETASTQGQYVLTDEDGDQLHFNDFEDVPAGLKAHYSNK